MAALGQGAADGLGVGPGHVAHQDPVAVAQAQGRIQGPLAERFGDVAATEGHPIRATTKDLTAILDMDKLFANPDMRVDLGQHGQFPVEAGEPNPPDGRR